MFKLVQGYPRTSIFVVKRNMYRFLKKPTPLNLSRAEPNHSLPILSSPPLISSLIHSPPLSLSLSQLSLSPRHPTLSLSLNQISLSLVSAAQRRRPQLHAAAGGEEAEGGWWQRRQPSQCQIRLSGVRRRATACISSSATPSSPRWPSILCVNVCVFVFVLMS